MTSSDLIVVAWLVTAHLLADFVLQTDRMVIDKFGHGSRAWAALLRHVAVVALLVAPLVVFGVRGLLYAVVTTSTHLVVDRLKIVLTRRVEPRPASAPEPSAEEVAAGPPLDVAWTPTPGALFMADQVAHVVILLGAWLVLLSGQPPIPEFASLVDGALRGTDRELFHRAVLTGLVLLALAIVNVRAASLFVGTLVRAPSDGPPSGHGDASGEDTTRAAGTRRVDPLHPDSVVSRAATPQPPAPRAYTVRLGRLVGRVEPDAAPASPSLVPERDAAGARHSRRVASPARVGEAIGVLERLLIVGLVLTGAVASIGLVVAAKTLARFKQLDDREFAEYYLLGTLASVTVAVLSGLVAQAVLAAP